MDGAPLAASHEAKPSQLVMKILVLPGDGIGSEITEATVAVLTAADKRFGLGLELERDKVGFAALKEHGSACPPALFEKAKAADGIILGPISHNEYPPVAQGGVNPSARFRIGLDLFANMRPAKCYAGIPSVVQGMDLLIARENTEGFYADRNMFAGSGEFMPVPGVGLAMRKITAAGCRRIALAGFREAMRRRRHVTAVHKSNVMRMTDGMFLEETRRVAAEFPDVIYDEMLVDAAAAWLVRKPSRFDVIVTTNMFGDILSDEASELAGSLGLAGSINAGEAHAMAQAQHGSAPDIAGQGIANPLSLVLSAAMLLGWLSDRQGHKACRAAAAAIEKAVATVVADPALHTPDLGGAARTSQVAESLCAALGG
jgi:isocitrate/isopropylmalate dehydrogenase